MEVGTDLPVIHLKKFADSGRPFVRNWRLWKFRLSNRLYNCFSKLHKSKKRLFLTTGNLSLLNVLALIRQLKARHPRTRTEDYLLVSSHSCGESFDEAVHIMATLHPFKRIYKTYRLPQEARFATILRNGLSRFDEVFVLNTRPVLTIAHQLFPGSKKFIIEESAATVCAQPFFDYDSIEKIYFNTYLNKLDYCALSSQNAAKIVPLKKDILLSVMNTCASKYPLRDLPEISPQDKVVVYCDTQVSPSSPDFKDMFNWKKRTLKRLVACGYKVLYKKHPRDTTVVPDVPQGVISMDAVLPLESYTWPNCVAIVSWNSSSSLQNFYFRGIPGFVGVTQTAAYRWFADKLTAEYTPNIEELFALGDVRGLALKDVAERLEKIYVDFLSTKPKLSQNQHLMHIAEEMGYFKGKRVLG